MGERIRNVGLDVSKATVQVAVADSGKMVTEHGSMENDPGGVRRLMKILGQDAALASAF